VDARPSDAIALAVRKKCPVYIAENIVDAAGVSVNLIVDAAAGRGTRRRRRARLRSGGTARRSRALEAELERAVTAEEYERAAAIRDLLAAMDTSKKEHRPQNLS
jgi:protein-arginine kinase activator protein McsA